MKILSVGNFGNSWDGSVCDEENIAKALEGLGHTVVRLQREYIPDQADYDDFDFTLLAQWHSYPETFNFPRPIVYWAFDFQKDDQAWHQRLISQADLYLSHMLTDVKYPNWQWFAQDFAPDFLVGKNELADKTMDVLFTGSYLDWGKERIGLLRAVNEEFDLTIRSFTPGSWENEGFKKVYGPVMDQGLKNLYPSAKINLSIDLNIEPGYWSDRNAQIMCCGGFVLYKYVPLSSTVFHDNVAYFSTISDCLEQISYYLEHEDEREAIADKGCKYASEYLTATAKAKELVIAVAGSLNG